MRARTDGDFLAIGALRYRCYRMEGLINETPSRVFIDEFDHSPRAQVYAVYHDGVLVSSVRLHVLDASHAASATYRAFSDILTPLIDSGLTLVDGARFVVDAELGSLRLSIAWQTLKICLRVADEIAADFGVAAVQPAQVRLYERIYGFHQMAEPRDYGQLTKKLALIGVDFSKKRAANS